MKIPKVKTTTKKLSTLDKKVLNDILNFIYANYEIEGLFAKKVGKWNKMSPEEFSEWLLFTTIE